MTDLRLHILLNSLPEIPSAEGPLDGGLQDKGGATTAGRPVPGDRLVFEATVGIVEKGDGIDFRGPLVHGPPGARFLYLSWKRRAGDGPPWFQRVKIPLVGLAARLEPGAPMGGVAQADITGRRPHDPRPVEWTSAPA